MSVIKKVLRGYDRRQREYNEMMAKQDGDHKVRERMTNGGYKRPGSRNPRKARTG